jgi:hypothetical protein
MIVMQTDLKLLARDAAVEALCTVVVVARTPQLLAEVLKRRHVRLHTGRCQTKRRRTYIGPLECGGIEGHAVQTR